MNLTRTPPPLPLKIQNGNFTHNRGWNKRKGVGLILGKANDVNRDDDSNDFNRDDDDRNYKRQI
jgi:hypothetical protein